jgi:pectate lyase
MRITRRKLVITAGATLIVLVLGVMGVTLLTPPREPLAFATSAPQPVEGLAVFPGAEGFGTRTRAGRGGKVVFVTSLADSGPGTLREALAYPEPRTVLFRVGGIIELKSHLFIEQPFITIAAQTAPGDGIVLKDFGINILTHDVLIQHLRIRPGNKGDVRVDHNDAIAILGPTGSSQGSYNVVIDHVSTSWAEDETVSTWFGPHDITISWSIISEALNRSRHPKRTHSAGLMIADRSDRTSIHHNLLAHNDFRNPLIATGGTHDVVNNVVYDWGSLVTEMTEDAPTMVNIVGNYYRPGRSSQSPYPIFIQPSEHMQALKLFVADNVLHDRGPVSEAWSMVQSGWKGSGAPARYRAEARFMTAPITATGAIEAFDAVLTGAGATHPKRDAVDSRIVSEVRTGAGRIIDSPDEVGGFPQYNGGTAPVDSDDDGMPDEWERSLKLDPQSPADGAMDADRDGYTNLEEYLHSLAPATTREAIRP